MDLQGKAETNVSANGGGQPGTGAPATSFILTNYLEKKIKKQNKKAKMSICVEPKQPTTSGEDAPRSAAVANLFRAHFLTSARKRDGDGGGKISDFAILSVRFSNDGVAQGR